ncbi:MAG: hypothetical protein JWQ40_1637 [Segetibacter sp.]|jgi:hypothetical protein|nr:hypothetical protein [Segetibacter sp.]
MKYSISHFKRFFQGFSAGKCMFFIAGAVGCQVLSAQTTVPLTDLSYFQNAGTTWRIASDVRGDFAQRAVLTTTPGSGILVNITDFNNTGSDLISTMQHGDMDLELDYMMALGSNSGIYMQGRYEIQLLDSWGVVNPKAGDNGGIYERWNEGKPQGQKGYEGHAPRLNASRAPGLWQHMKISFQAPHFNTAGQKTDNAKILRVELNGFTIQENVELSGPTRGALGNDEVPMGPLRLQGDHGPVAFRNIKVTTFDKPRPELLNLKYFVYKGKFEAQPDYKKQPPDAEGTSVILSSNVSNLENEFFIRYTGTLRVKEAGDYSFNLGFGGGRGAMTINNKEVITMNQRRSRGRVTLPAGDLPFELLYSKIFDFAKPSLGLAVGGPGIREYVISDQNVASGDPVDPIYINAPVNTVLRSFMDVDTIRVTHAVNVGSAQQLHYTYDMDKGMIVQAWRGGFLDATPMWHSRGDGSSRPAGSVLRFGIPIMALQTLGSANAAWSADTAGTGYRPKGYILDANDRPTFRYHIYGATVSDATRVLDNNQGLRREISVENAPANTFLRLAVAKTIETGGDGLYILDDKSYYLRVDDAGTVKPVIRDSNGQKELIVPVQNKISYSILF